MTLAIELASLDINPVLSNCHSKILHCKNRPVLAATLTTAAVTWSLDTKWRALVLGFAAWWTRRLSGNRESSCRAQRAHGIVGVGIRCADTAVLVCIGCNVGDELLGGESQEARQAGVGLRRWRETSLCHVVVGDSIRDLYG